MFLAGSGTRIDLGPISLNGALTLGVAGFTLCMLPVFMLNARCRQFSLLPWAIWLFLCIVLLYLTPLVPKGSSTSFVVQNASVYIIFIGGIVFTGAMQSHADVLLSWRLMRKASVVLIYAALALAVSGLSQHFGNRSLSIVLLLALAIVIAGVPENNWVRLAPFVATAAIAITLSRTATAVALVLLTFLALKIRGQGRRVGAKRFWTISVTGAAAIVAYLLFTYYSPFRQRFLAKPGDDAFQFGGMNINARGRARLWELLTNDITLNNIWLGHGLGSASSRIKEHIPKNLHPHNEYLRLLYEFGILGLALFIIGYLTLMWRAWQNARLTDHPLHWSALMALLSVSMMAVTDNPFVYPYVMLPMGSLVGLSIAKAAIDANQCSAPKLNVK
jgi:hypothetical protein